MKNYVLKYHKFFLTLLAILIIIKTAFSSYILSSNNFNFIFSNTNVLISIYLSILFILLFGLLVFAIRENIINYFLAFVAPVSVSFIFGYSLFDEILLIVTVTALFFSLNYDKILLNLRKNYIENKYYFYLILALLIYALFGLYFNNNIKNLRYVALFSCCISFILFISKDQLKVNIKYLFLGFAVYLLSYVTSGIFHGIYFIASDHSILLSFLDHYEIENIYLSILSSMFVFGLLGPGGINGTEVSIYICIVVSLTLFYLSTKPILPKYNYWFSILIIFISINLNFIEQSRNLLIAVLLPIFIFLINSKFNKKSIYFVLFFTLIFCNEFYKLRNIKDSEGYLKTTLLSTLQTFESFDLTGTIRNEDPMISYKVETKRNDNKNVSIKTSKNIETNLDDVFSKLFKTGNLVNRKVAQEKIYEDNEARANHNIFRSNYNILVTSKGDTSRFIHILIPIQQRYLNLIDDDNESRCYKSKKLRSLKEILFGVWTYGYYPNNLNIIDCIYQKNDIKITRELLKSNSGIAEPPRVSTLAIFINEYGIVIFLLLISYIINKDSFRIFNNNRTLINYLPIFVIIFLGISTHIQDNVIFWILIINSNLRNLIIKELD